MKPLFAMLFLALCAAIVFFYFQSTKKTPEQQANGNRQLIQPQDNKDQDNVPQRPNDAPAPNVAGGGQLPNPQPQNQQPQKQNAPEPHSPNHQIAGTPDAPKKRFARNSESNVAVIPKRNDSELTNPDSITDDPGTRNVAPRITGVALVAVKRIAVAAFGAETLNPQLREALVKALQATGRFDLVESDAEAVLKISIKRESLLPPDNLANATLIARLANAKGQIIWPATAKGAGVIYQGNADTIAAKIAADILSEIQRQERKK
jgi:hypothetical protein